MRRMFGKLQLVALTIATMASNIVDALRGKEIDVEGITSKGIANTGGLANIGDVAISGDLNVQGEGKGKVTANTLEQLNPNYSLSFEMTGSNGLSVTNNIYNRFESFNNILYCISNIEVTNNTENPISIGQGDIIAQAVVTLAEEIAGKIYNLEGKTLAEVPSNPQAGVAMEKTAVATNINMTSFISDVVFNIIQPQQARVVYVGFRLTESITINAGSKRYLSARIALTLL